MQQGNFKHMVPAGLVIRIYKRLRDTKFVLDAQ